jgi:hypothetical protein
MYLGIIKKVGEKTFSAIENELWFGDGTPKKNVQAIRAIINKRVEWYKKYMPVRKYVAASFFFFGLVFLTWFPFF